MSGLTSSGAFTLCDITRQKKKKDIFNDLKGFQGICAECKSRSQKVIY